MNNSRRKFLKNAAKVTGGAALVGLATPVTGFVKATEQEEPEQPDFKWEPEELPCNLISETTDENTKEGYRSFTYKQDGRVHITHVDFLINEKDYTVSDVQFYEGCDGSTEGVAKIAEGKDAEYIIKSVKGLQCNLIKSGSSCPDHLAVGIEQALNIMKDTACGHCFFAGNYSMAKCTDYKQFYRA